MVKKPPLQPVWQLKGGSRIPIGPLLFSIAILPISYGVVVSIDEPSWQFSSRENGRQILYFLTGLILWASIYLFYFQKNPTFLLWRCFDHEIWHVVAAILTGSGVHSISVNRSGRGSVQTSRRLFVIEQTPYVISIPMACSAFAMTVAGIGPSWWSSLIIGGVLGYHVTATVTASRNDRQADIRPGYRMIHLVLMAAGTLWWTVLAYALALDGSIGVKMLIKEIWSNSIFLLAL